MVENSYIICFSQHFNGTMIRKTSSFLCTCKFLFCSNLSCTCNGWVIPLLHNKFLMPLPLTLAFPWFFCSWFLLMQLQIVGIPCPADHTIHWLLNHFITLPTYWPKSDFWGLLVSGCLLGTRWNSTKNLHFGFSISIRVPLAANLICFIWSVRAIMPMLFKYIIWNPFNNSCCSFITCPTTKYCVVIESNPHACNNSSDALPGPYL